jgi:hypothetical protein
MPIIKLTQVIDQHTLKEIGDFEMKDKWERLQRIFALQTKPDEKYAVWIDLMSDNGQDLTDKQIAISASQAVWLLRDFFKQPKKIWSKVKTD